MADADLMNFDPEGEGSPYQDENDENDTPGLAPSLVGSPVIKNSILKQSTKDNLIQLFTPVQKPEKGKLKVHFGRDSLLETPNITVKKRVAIPDSIGEKPADEPIEGGQKERHVMTDVAVSGESSVSQQKLTGNQHASSSEDVAMETSICEIQNAFELDLDSRVLDILSSTDAFLKSLCNTEPTKPRLEELSQPKPVSEATSDEATAGSACDGSDADNEKIEREKVIETVHNSGDNGSDSDQVRLELKLTGTKSNDLHSEAAVTEEEPMDCEEMMDVDDEEDDEVIFNLKKPVGDTRVLEEVKEEVEENKEPETQQESEQNNTEAKQNKNKNVPVEYLVEAKREVIAEKEIGKTVVEIELNVKTEDHENQQCKETKQESANKSEKLKSDDASDEEEFMSADEEMDVDPTTPAKKLSEQEHGPSPPLKTPPKIGYSIDLNNFNLDAVDPFSTKKSLMNSPDVGEKTKPAAEKVAGHTKPATENVAGQTKPAYEKVADKAKSEIETKKPLISVPEKHISEENVIDKNEKSSKRSQELNKDAAKVVDKDEKVSIAEEKHQENQPTGKPVNDDEMELQPVKDAEKKAELSIVLEDVKSNQDKNCVQTAPVVHTSSPAIPTTRGAYNLDFLDKLDEINPFQSKAQMMNSPLNTKSGSTQESSKDNPFKTKTQIINSPLTSKNPRVPVNNTDVVEPKLEHSEKEKCKETDVDNIVPQEDIWKSKVDEKKECENPLEAGVQENHSETDYQKFGSQQSEKQPESVGILELDNNYIDNIDPFKPSKQMVNSPEVKAKTNVNVGTQKEEVDAFKPTKQVANSSATINRSESNVSDIIEGIDPLKPKKQVANSQVPTSKDKVKNAASGNGKEIDDCQPKAQFTNSPISKADTVARKLKTENMEEVNPFQTKKQVANSPVANTNIKADKNEPLDFEDIDPFKTKRQIANSPVKSAAAIGKTETEPIEEIDPFKPKQQMQNSPFSKPAKVEKSSKQIVQDETDLFKPKKQIQNSPDKSLSKSNEIDLDNLDEIDPFKPKKQMQNSPDTKSKAPVKAEDAVDSDTVDPFKPRKQLQMMNSPANRKGKATLSQIVEQDHENSSLETSPADVKPEGQADKDVNKTGAAKEKQALSQPALDLFSDLNPPELRKKENLQLSNKVSLLEGDEDTFEVHGVTRRGQSGAMTEYWGDVEDAQFVPASEVFNDPAAWDMLEKIGNNASKETESALSRMSLYVKFDPLVDPAPSSYINPRRISIRASQLEKVKEYGLDETLLLLGTPPKKRRQSLMGVHAANSNRGTPTNPNPQVGTARNQGNQPPVKKLEPAQTPNPVDLILAYSPGKESKPDSAAKPLPMGILFGQDVEESTEENLFQELKYTDADLRRLRTEMRLEAQGVLMGKEREFCTEREAWGREREEILRKWNLDCKEYRKLEQIFNMLEKTCYEISGAKAETENKIVELKKDHEQALEDLAAMERSFWDLHKRYEKTKEMFLNLKKNEETLKKHLDERVEQQRKQEEKYTRLKEMSEEKLKLASQEIEKLEQSQKVSEEKLKTEKKISDMKVNNLEMKISNLESMLQKKTEDVKQLTEICDGLLAQVGK
ncbi:titin homolog isoform X2 [Dreissena polymorpha]|nr:titin homolog isoform X2 [Dreissena polymorpha]